MSANPQALILAFLAGRTGISLAAPTVGKWQRRMSPLRYQWEPHRHPRDLHGKFVKGMQQHAIGELKHVGGLPVRRHGEDEFSIETEKGHKKGTAAQIAEHIVSDHEKRRVEGKPWVDALSRTEGWTEPDVFTDPGGADAEAAGFSKLPRGARVVSIDPNTIGRMGTVVKGEKGQKAVKLDGTGETVSSVAFEPIDKRHSWRIEGMKAGPATKQNGLFDEPEPEVVEEELPADAVIEPEPSPAAASDVNPRIALANVFEKQLRAGETITAKSLLAAADDAYGGTRAQGKHDPSGVYDSLEAGFNKALAGETDPTVGLKDALAQIDKLDEAVNQLPTQTNRSGNKVAFQQFSTPPHYAYAIAWLANLTDGDLVLEPTAGTGCLATQAKNAGADVFTNELDPARADLLKDQFGNDKVSVEDASQLGAILPNRGIKPTAVVMNPPFSQTAGRMGDKKDLMTGANHITQALQALEPGGRLVAIVSGGIQRAGEGRAGMCPESSTYAEWFRKLAANGYDLRANVGVDGDVYKKYGTNFGTRVLVIDKTGGQKNGTVPSGDVETIPELMQMLEGVRNDRPSLDLQPSGERAGEPASAGPGQVGRDDAALLGAGADGDAGSLSAPGGSQGDAAFAGGDNELVGGRSQHTGPGDPQDAAASGVAGAEGAPGQPGAKPETKPKRGRGRPGGKSVARVALNVPQLVFDQIGELRAVAPVPFAEAPPEEKPEAGGDQAELGASVFEPFKPSIHFKGMHEHITPLVESAGPCPRPAS